MDWKQLEAKVIANIVGNEVYPGTIVLMHDGDGDRTQTVSALEAVLQDLVGQGYTMEPMYRWTWTGLCPGLPCG